MKNIKSIKEQAIDKMKNSNGEIQNNDYEEVTLKEVVEKCFEFSKGEIQQDDFNEWLDKIFVLFYLPIELKYDIIEDFLYSNDNFENMYESPIEIKFEVGKWFYLMLAYTNINVYDYTEYVTIENYDITVRYLSGLLDKICGEDYKRMIELYDRIMDLNNFNNIMQLISNLPLKDDNQVYEDLSKTFKELEDNKELIDELSKIVDFNNPGLKGNKINNK